MLRLSLGYSKQQGIVHSVMVTYYCISIEEALRRAKLAGKKPGCYYGGITLPSGKKGFAIYKEGKIIEKYTALKLSEQGKHHNQP